LICSAAGVYGYLTFYVLEEGDIKKLERRGEEGHWGQLRVNVMDGGIEEERPTSLKVM
jgi:hypothetical protein